MFLRAVLKIRRHPNRYLLDSVLENRNSIIETFSYKFIKVKENIENFKTASCKSFFFNFYSIETIDLNSGSLFVHEYFIDIRN